VNFWRRLFHRPSARVITAFERKRAEALIAYADAVKRGDTRQQHERYAEAKRMTTEVLKLEAGR
jgi:hypothetical protein